MDKLQTDNMVNINIPIALTPMVTQSNEVLFHGYSP